MPTYILVRADPNETIETWKLNSAEWSEGLGEVIHVQREQAQVDTFVSAKHSPAQINWILRAEDSDDILAACESLYRPAILYHNGVKKEGMAYGIASVFCRAAYRGKGYASTMMSMVAKELQQEHILGSALWSDIGPDFYERFGWKTYPSWSTVITVIPGHSDRTYEYLSESDLSSLCERDCDHIRTSMQPGFSFLPTFDVIRWHHARSKFMLNVHRTEWELPSQDDLSEQVGIKIEDDFAIWNPQFAKERVLFILRLQYTSPDRLQTILQAAVDTAIKFKLHRVVIWNDDIDLPLKNVFSIEYLERSTSLSALMLKDNDITWHNNEKFCWC